jgi:hypothetical protein
MPRLLVSAALISLACLTLPLAAQAKPPQGITIDAEVGYNGMVQLSRINPLVVDLENNSSSVNLSGDLVLTYNGVEYATKLELPTPSKKRFFLYFPCDAYPPTLSLMVRTKAYTEEFILNALFKTVKPEDMSILVLTQQSGCLGVANQLPAVRLFRDPYRNHTTQFGSATTHVYYYDIDEIEANPKFFAGTDCIVLADVDYQQATPQLAEALGACAAGGVNLVFSLGLNGQAVAGSALAPLCPLQCSGTRQLTDLGRFGAKYDFKSGGTAATFATGQLAPGASVRESAGDTPAVVTALRGSGTATALAFDVTAVPFKQNPQLAPLLADYALGVAQSVSMNTWFVHPEQVSTELARFREGRPMAPGFVLLFLLAYVVLIGPVNFIALSRLKRRPLVWTTIPLLIIGFSYFGLSTGYLYRGSDNVVAVFQELHLFPDAKYTPYQNELLIFTAERTRYQLDVPDASAYFYADLPVVQGTVFGGQTGAFRGLSSGRVDNSEAPRIAATQGKWTSKEYFYQGYLGLPASFSSAVSAVPTTDGLQQLNGTVTLNLPFDLHDCYLYDGHRATKLGSLKGKSTCDLAAAAKPDLGGLDSENYLAQAVASFTNEQQQASQLGLNYRRELLLVGFTDQVKAEIGFNKPHKSYNLGMVVLHIPYSAVNDPQAPATLAGWRLTGGSGFELDQNSYWGDQTDLQRLRYRLQAKSYFDATYDLGGKVDGGTNLLLHFQAWNSSDQQPLSDLSMGLTVNIWDGEQWREHKLRPNELVADIPVRQYLPSGSSVTVRFTATADFLVEVPWAEVY